ncbi:splicing factor YJU2 [Eucalyptus grandis]|uniref:splicing factor YJU2 n=1 Tax=Eucalyptus grandis TaxID=71139 RepID=UPI00192E765C|nr:splicing factor YJU2 [Eucalyptus grandis]
MGERYRRSSTAVPWGLPPGSICRRPPPIWPDHERLPVRRPRNRRPTKVRIMLPISVRCDACGNRIDKGSKLSSRKEEVAVAVAGEADLGIPEFRFCFGCTGCSAELAIKTDQRNSYCIVESGGTRVEGPDVPELTDDSEKMHCQPSGHEE